MEPMTEPLDLDAIENVANRGTAIPASVALRLVALARAQAAEIARLKQLLAPLPDFFEQQARGFSLDTTRSHTQTIAAARRMARDIAEALRPGVTA